MKKIILLLTFCLLAVIVLAQKETFDLITYSPPKGWKKEVSDNTTSYTIFNNKNKTWCGIYIEKSTTSKGTIEQDFDSEWQGLIVSNYKPTEAPQLNELEDINGWKIKAGSSKFVFNNSEAIVLLTTATGYNRCVSIVATYNSQDHMKDVEAVLASVELIKPETYLEQNTRSTNGNATVSTENSVIGTWTKTGSVNPDYYDSYATSIAGYSKDQYSFSLNGTYHFISKTFGMSFDKILLVKENGTYQINGNTIIINPQKSIIEAWSKKNGVDKWGRLLSSQKRTLEKTTYQFTKHYFPGIQQWNLVLQGNKATQRDGPFSTNATFTNAWYYSPTTTNSPVIELPDGQ